MQCAATEPGGCWGAPSLRTVTPRGRASLLHAHLRAPRETFPLPPAEDEPIAPLLSEHQCHLEFPLWAATWKVSLRSPPCTAKAPLSTGCRMQCWRKEQPAEQHHKAAITPTGFALSQPCASLAWCVMMHHRSGGCGCTPGPTQLPPGWSWSCCTQQHCSFSDPTGFNPKAILAHSPSQLQTRSPICTI